MKKNLSFWLLAIVAIMFASCKDDSFETPAEAVSVQPGEISEFLAAAQGIRPSAAPDAASLPSIQAPNPAPKGNAPAESSRCQGFLDVNGNCVGTGATTLQTLYSQGAVSVSEMTYSMQDWYDINPAYIYPSPNTPTLPASPPPPGAVIYPVLFVPEGFTVAEYQDFLDLATDVRNDFLSTNLGQYMLANQNIRFYTATNGGGGNLTSPWVQSGVDILGTVPAQGPCDQGIGDPANNINNILNIKRLTTVSPDFVFDPTPIGGQTRATLNSLVANTPGISDDIATNPQNRAFVFVIANTGDFVTYFEYDFPGLDQQLAESALAISPTDNNNWPNNPFGSNYNNWSPERWFKFTFATSLANLAWEWEIFAVSSYYNCYFDHIVNGGNTANYADFRQMYVPGSQYYPINWSSSGTVDITINSGTWALPGSAAFVDSANSPLWPSAVSSPHDYTARQLSDIKTNLGI